MQPRATPTRSTCSSGKPEAAARRSTDCRRETAAEEVDDDHWNECALIDAVRARDHGASATLIGGASPGCYVRRSLADGGLARGAATGAAHLRGRRRRAARRTPPLVGDDRCAAQSSRGRWGGAVRESCWAAGEAPGSAATGARDGGLRPTRACCSSDHRTNEWLMSKPAMW